MQRELVIVSQTDQTIRFNIELDGKPKGELQTSREQFTKLCDLLFPISYKVVENDKSPKAKPVIGETGE